jgi:hypothetical protein
MYSQIGMTPENPIQIKSETIELGDLDYSHLVGKVYGTKKIIKAVSRSKSNNRVVVLCQCTVCDLYQLIQICNVRKSKKCQCGNSSLSKFYKKEYRIWSAMKTRCTNKLSKCYKRYGGRGISYCKSWQLFDNFILDMGPRPSDKHEIDRIDNNGNYEPSNCRWVTRSANNRNKNASRTVDFLGEKIHIFDLADRYGVKYWTIAKRYDIGKRGMDLVK